MATSASTVGLPEDRTYLLHNFNCPICCAAGLSEASKRAAPMACACGISSSWLRQPFDPARGI